MSLAKDNQIHSLLSRTTKMVRDFLLEEVFHDLSEEQLAHELGLDSTFEIRRLLGDGELITPEAAIMCRALGLDMGFAIRDVDTGKEVTFYAAENFGSKKNYEMQTEEIQHYGEETPEPTVYEDPIDGLEGIPVVHERVTVCDGDFDVDKELGEDTIEAEFSEITQRDLEEFENKCENCLEEDRLPDSMLCFHCTALGIECNPPEDPERPEDYEIEPLQLVALVNRSAQDAEERSERLLEAAGMLRNHNED